ncbi:MAG: hypothetical protein ABI680_20185 [Chthoniobacteraceae bacterium]
MRQLLTSLSFCLLLVAGGEARGQEGNVSAFGAVRLLAPERQSALAMVVARGGTPVPERWYLLTFDPAAEAGLREFVVAGGKIVAERIVSQFAETMTGRAVFEPESLKIDSDRAATMANAFCQANKVEASALHYDLRRGDATGAPLWTVICVTEKGEELGRVIISATTGVVIAHPGLREFPSAEQLVGKVPSIARREPDEKPEPPSTSRSRPSKPERRAIPRAQPAPTPKPNVFRRIFGGGDR